ncbi:tripartite tricarboxylate transporter substrate binding protein [Variovorax sp. J31P207]|uniref:Bug family tripartite tricarboxylate transporter substrate binding protein n=1 Tax=Variovorax sp. J31P207 TaxID=3053510 RepID=UPI0025760AAF|nr:tripartite tricarboxylate transporter substrate binding protein [Variovorax sp. J31P207]MDM0072694.1 tripartite tricarboxylate transporter substrate binding protein [Variovorax sp. J31P207]
MKRKQFVIVAAGALFLLGFASLGAFAQDYPAKPIRAIVPYSAGGGTDLVGRLVFQKLGEALGQPIYVENKVGGSGTIGLGELARSKPDGYTIGIGGNGVSLLGALIDGLKFNPATDLVPVATLASVPIALVAGPGLPVKSMREFIDYAKKNKATALTYGSPGVGTPHHLMGVELARVLKIPMVHVPYKGTAPAMSDVVGGHIPIAIVGLPGAMQFTKNPLFTILGVASARRSELAPEIPTIAEGGVPGFEASYWWDISVPKGTPQPIIDRLHKEVVKILSDPGVRDSLLKGGFEPMVMSLQEMNAALKVDTAKWIKVIRDNNIRAGE